MTVKELMSTTMLVSTAVPRATKLEMSTAVLMVTAGD